MTTESSGNSDAQEPPESALPEPSDRWWALPLAIATATVALRLAYAMLLGDYEDNLFSDMGGYWKRAHDHLFGNLTAPSQWIIQAPLFHAMISNVLGGLQDSPLLWDARLEVIIIIQALLGGLASFYLYFLTQNLTGSSRVAAVMAAFYGLTFPLLYLNAYVMTENVSIPLLIAAGFYLTRSARTSPIVSILLMALLCTSLRFPLHYTAIAMAVAYGLHWLAGKDDSVVASAVCLAMAIAIRPATLPFIAPVLLFALFRHSRSPSWRAAGIYLASFAAAVSIVSYYNDFVSSGAVSGLGAGGGGSFYFAQCDYDRVTFIYKDMGYWFVQPGSERKANPRTAPLTRPPFEQDVYYAAGLECMRENPNVLAFNGKRIGRLYGGTFFPAVDRPGWEGALVATFYLGVFAPLSLVLLLSSPFVFKRGDLFEDRGYWLMLGLFGALIAMHMIFGAEQRYLLPGVFVIYLGAALALARLFPGLAKRLEISAPQAPAAPETRSTSEPENGGAGNGRLEDGPHDTAEGSRADATP